VPLYVPLAVPYWNHAVVDVPLVFTVAFNVAELDVILVAVPVITVGTTANVVKDVSLPYDIPALFCPTTL